MARDGGRRARRTGERHTLTGWVPLVVAVLASCGGISEQQTGGGSSGETDGGVGASGGASGGVTGGVGATSMGATGGSDIDDGGASFSGGVGAVGGSVPMGATGGATPGGGGTGVGAVGAVGGSGVIGPDCRGIRTAAACEKEGLLCNDLPCGLANAGMCQCFTTWSCTVCDFTGTILENPPANITTCTGVEQDGVSCATLDALCSGAANGEACACYIDDEGAQIWDCDKVPYTWEI